MWYMGIGIVVWLLSSINLYLAFCLRHYSMRVSSGLRFCKVVRADGTHFVCWLRRNEFHVLNIKTSAGEDYSLLTVYPEIYIDRQNIREIVQITSFFGYLAEGGWRRK